MPFSRFLIRVALLRFIHAQDAFMLQDQNNHTSRDMWRQWFKKITNSERQNSKRRLFCNSRSPYGHVIHRCGWISGGEIFVFAPHAIKPEELNAQEPAKL